MSWDGFVCTTTPAEPKVPEPPEPEPYYPIG
jgi:hypothetical protein